MKRPLHVSGVALTLVCCTLAFASERQIGQTNAVKPATAAAKAETANPGYGISLGTVNVQYYGTSEYYLEFFESCEYLAILPGDTYMGFRRETDIITDPETANQTYYDYAIAEALNTGNRNVTVPDSINMDGKIYPVKEINWYYPISSNVKTLTVPATIERINVGYDFGQQLESAYMLGNAPYSNGYLRPATMYVVDENCIESYLNNNNFAYSAIVPYGWDYPWTTVNVEKAGEFAETYLTQNDYNWGNAINVKVTGNINDVDLKAIKNLVNLMKLDLSETNITSLPESFMANRSSLVEVKLPTALKSIGNDAFYGCSSLQTFDLNSITTIGESVFAECRALSYINLNGVQEIKSRAFRNCTALNNIDLSTVSYLWGNAFSGCTALESVDLTSAVAIGGDAYGSNVFSGCSSLKNIIFGDRLQIIGSSAFRGTGIENITLPEGITTVPNELFYGCSNLVSAELPGTIVSINSGAFEICSALTEVKMKTGLTSIAARAFRGCQSLTDVTIPATVKSIGDDAFGTTSIKSFRCYAAVPPMANSSFIGNNMDMSRTYLYVPPFSKDFYRNTEYWSNFYLMRSIEDQIDYILVDRPLTINLEEEDNAAVANNPTIELSAGNYTNYRSSYSEISEGQLTAYGEGTLSAGELIISGTLASRNNYYNRYCPTLINHADKMRADNVTVNLSLYNGYESGLWHFISLPFDVKVSDIVPSNDTYWVIRRYDSAARALGETSATWVNLTESDVMEAGKGYIISAAGGEKYTDSYGSEYTASPRFTFKSGNTLSKNNLFRPVDIIVTLEENTAEFAHNRSWNLIGNPYPCYFDMHFLNEEFTAPVTVWNGNSYVAYSPVDDDLVLSPFEAFFVQCPLDATEMTFKAEGRLHSAEGKNAANAPALEKTISAEDRNVFNFIVYDNNSSDRARIVLNPEATAAYEIGRDASKFFSDGDNAQLYVSADVNYSIDERPVGDGAAILGIRSGKESVCKISLGGRYSNEWRVLLTDSETGITTDLTEKDYEFVAKKGDSSKRFSVVFELSGNESGIEAIAGAFGKDTEITVTGVNGTVVYRGRMSGMSVSEPGLYIISDSKETRKALLK